MIKDETTQLMALEFTDKFNLCAYINGYHKKLNIINITHDNGLYTIFYLENK